MRGANLVSLAVGLAASLAVMPVRPSDRLLVVGGGALPQDSQVSIESNVIWIDGLLRERAFAAQTLLFAAGSEGPPDVVLHQPEDSQAQRWLPLARVQGAPHDGISVFRRNRVPDGPGASHAANVTTALRASLASLSAGDSLFFVYNGHGSWGEPDAAHNALRLWGDSQLDVRQFSGLLDARAAGSTVRYVLPQCFSGGFARALFGDPARPRAAEVKPNQCGFFAVPENLEAEGCTPGIDAGEYRDYSTYFFAALAGETRLGGPLSRDPDLDRDGQVTLSEAHAYAYTEGESADLPFATSEYFLETWQPWYVRWQTAIKLAADNPYLRLASRLAELAGVKAGDPAALAAETLGKRRELDRKISAQEDLIDDLDGQEQATRQRMLTDLHQMWPATGLPYSGAYAAMLETQADALLAWIRAHVDFDELEALQIDLEQAELDLLDLQRRATRYTRIHRLLRLAAIREHFDILASKEARSRYDALLRCEGWAPPAPRQATHE